MSRYSWHEFLALPADRQLAHIRRLEKQTRELVEQVKEKRKLEEARLSRHAPDSVEEILFG